MSRLESKMYYLKNPSKTILRLGVKGLFNWLPDKPYLKLVYWGETGKKLNLDKPVTFNEKLQWLKLYDRNPDYCKFVDKYAVRSYVSELLGDEYLIPLLSIYDDVKEIDWTSLPNKFVLKCTHGSGCNIICSDKDNLDIGASVARLNKWMNKSWYWFGREWPYKNVKPRIICEEYMVDESGTELKDYKIFCFNGEPRLIQVDYNRFKGHKRNLYDTSWNYTEASIKYPTDSSVKIKKPDNLGKMLEFARKLAKNYPHIRVDFYSINEKIFFGEMTFYHGAGFEKFEPEEFGIEMGNWIKIPMR